MKYLITLKLQLGEFEKASYHLVEADAIQQACEAGLEAECHGDTPQWDSDRLGCWDCDEMYYRVVRCRGLDDNEAKVLADTMRRGD